MWLLYTSRLELRASEHGVYYMQRVVEMHGLTQCYPSERWRTDTERELKAGKLDRHCNLPMCISLQL